ncbi:MAG: NUDIX domain-containing protein [Polyangiales bacterium]
MAAQDLSERFDVLDERGEPAGFSRPRGEVHRDGDWHASVHVWILLRWQGRVGVVLQRRSMDKDTNPGVVDVSVGGHVRAGEGVFDALRECEEELGLAVTPEDVIPMGRLRSELRTDSVWDRELLSVFAAWVDAPPPALTPQAEELDEALVVAPDDALALWSGRAAEVDALSVPALGDARVNGVRGAPTRLRAGELLRPGCPYRVRALEALCALARGATPSPELFSLDGGVG